MLKAALPTLAAILLLAGCAQEPAPAAEPTPCLVTSATDMSCDTAGDALNGTGTDGARPHLHDYWNGRDRVDFEPVTLGSGALLCAPKAPVARFHPADGDTVFQGTSSVEVTLEFTPAPTDLPATFALAFKTAADNQTNEYGAIASGETVALNSSNDQNDLPHQRLSAWEFHLVASPANPTGCFSLQADVTLKVTIVRGLDIPLYPGHPDRWNGTDAQQLLDVEQAVFVFRQEAGGATCLNGPDGDDCLWQPFVPQDGAIVPPDSQAVVVTVTHTSDPLRVRLAYHDATTRELTFPDPTDDDGTTRRYVLDVAGGGDGPYAKQSQWEFWLAAEHATGIYRGTFTLEAEALREAP